jgi:hypothetical protein
VHPKLRQIKQLKAATAAFIAKRNRVKKYVHAEIYPRLAEDHLLRVILVFQYGEPRIDEPLALACERASSTLGPNSNNLLGIPISIERLIPLNKPKDDDLSVQNYLYK